MAAIVKFINYNDATSRRAKRLSDYMKTIGKIDVNCLISNGISVKNIERDLNIIHARYHPRGNRCFKQGVFSFGTAIDKDKAVDAVREVLSFFRDYPWVAAVHVDQPERVHAHLLLGTVNMFTGLKMSQSRSDLGKFRDYYDEVARKYELPLLNLKERTRAYVYKHAERQQYLYEQQENCFDQEPIFSGGVPWRQDEEAPKLPPAELLEQVIGRCSRMVDDDIQSFFAAGMEIARRKSVKKIKVMTLINQEEKNNERFKFD